MKPENKGVEGKALSQDFLFYYWNYSRQEKNLVKHSISFNTNGGSIYWRMTENESGKIRGLIRNLAEVAK